ncbi:MAG TPA: thioesterase family protein [Cyclobacteriaceae bacterium]
MMPRHFKVEIRVQVTDIDGMGHVNNVVYVRWAQEVAEAHWNHVASEEMKQTYSWVVLRHEVDYRHPAFVDDEVTGITWVGDHHGARFDRFIRIQTPNEAKLFAEIKTTWCLLDPATMKPLRIPSAILEIL